MNARYFDAHCHIQFNQFAEDQEELIARMHTEGVAGIVVGVDLESSQKAVALAEEHEHLYASVGLHPNRVEQEDFDEATHRALATHPKVVAIGECGLDYFRPENPAEAKAKQKEVLKRHIELAVECDRPLIIHSRPTKTAKGSSFEHPARQDVLGTGTMDAYHDVLEILRSAKEKYPNLTGDVHFFVGGIEEARAFIEFGFTISFTAVITFARDYDVVIRAIPLTSILSETDSPYVPPTNRTRGSRNDPLAVMDVVAKIAEIRGEDLETVRATLLENARRLLTL